MESDQIPVERADHFGIKRPQSNVPLELFMYSDHDELIGTCTGFIFEAKTGEYIVTNWHNVSGRNFLTGSYLNKQQKCPVKFKAIFRRFFLVHGVSYFSLVTLSFDLYTEDLQSPNWLEHPELGSKCDLVAFKFTRPDWLDKAGTPSANKIWEKSIPIFPGSDVSVVGFPGNVSVVYQNIITPIWKSGYIASEPDFDVQVNVQPKRDAIQRGGLTIPAIFVDASTRQGMSGSPVFARFTGKWNPENPYEPETTQSLIIGSHVQGTALKFLGIYSGRVGSQEEGTALGICWRESAIQTVCDGQVFGRHPHL